MWRHICAGALGGSCTYGRAPNAIDISKGSSTCPSKHRQGATLFLRLFQETAPFSRLLRHAGDTGVWVYWCFTSHATIFQSYMWRHRCAGGLQKLYLRSGSQRYRHFAGFVNVPVLHRHGTTRWFRHTAPFIRLLRHAGDTEDVFST